MTRSHSAGDLNLNDAAEQGTQNVLNVRPPSPLEVSKDWNIMIQPD